MNCRRYGLLSLGAAVCAAAGISALGASAVGASRPATKTEQLRVAAEVRLTLRVLADSPDSGIGHGLEIVLAPVCVSTIDARYAAAVANPILATGKVGQAGELFLHRVPGGYRVVGALRIGDQLARRPPDMPGRAWTDLNAKCQFQGAKAVLKLRATHAAPDFTT